MYKFTPILKTLVWGTESWVLSGVPGSESVVAEGPEAGKKITDIYPGTFPLLIKFIDAKRDLSIQVHPNNKLAAERHGCSGKSEMWYVIGAEPGAKLISGLKEAITPEGYVRLVAEHRITEVLAEHTVAPGDVFYLPAGRIHSIGGGCFLAEIQQTSDITYRIYDYNRPGLDGKPRQLHTQQAVDAIDYQVYPNYRTPYEPKLNAPVELVRSPYFTTTLYDFSGTAAAPAPLSGSASLAPDPTRVNGLAGALPLPDICQFGLDPESPFQIAIGLYGSGVLRTAKGEATLSAGEAVLIPASDGSVRVEPGPDGLRMLTTHP